MTGVIVEYLLGIYFLVVSIMFDRSSRRFNFDLVKLIAGIILIVLAVIGKSFAG